MAIRAQTIDLNLKVDGMLQRVYLNQGDIITNGLTFRIWDGSTRWTIPSGAIAIIEGTKPDMHGFQYQATISSNTVIANVTQQMTIVAGDVKTELRFTNSGGEDLGTLNFLLYIEESGLDYNLNLSNSELPMIVGQAKAQQEAAEKASKLSESWAIGGTGTRAGENVNNSKYWSEQSKILGEQQVELAKAQVKLSESWAVGGTGTRAGEDVDNAKYYNQLAKSWAVGSTGKRTGEDTDNSKYYSIVSSNYSTNSQNYANQSKNSADESNDYSVISKSWAVGGTGKRVGEETNNAKYYSEYAEVAVQNAEDRAKTWAVGGTGMREGEDTDNAKYYSIISGNKAEEAKNSADIAASYSDIIVPTFYLDLETMILYRTNEANGIDFVLDENKHLQYEFTFA